MAPVSPFRANWSKRSRGGRKSGHQRVRPPEMTSVFSENDHMEGAQDATSSSLKMAKHNVAFYCSTHQWKPVIKANLDFKQIHVIPQPLLESTKVYPILLEQSQRRRPHPMFATRCAALQKRV